MFVSFKVPNSKLLTVEIQKDWIDVSEVYGSILTGTYRDEDNYPKGGNNDSVSYSNSN